MGHANLRNLSDFFVNRLYAKGSLSLKEAAEAAEAASQTLHASEGEYDEAHFIALGFVDIINMLSRADPAAAGYGGFMPNAGPWIVPDLSVWQGRKKDAQAIACQLLRTCEQKPDDADLHCVAADALSDAGQEEWAWYVRRLPALREAVRKWFDPKGDIYEDEMDDGWTVFDDVKWRFAPGWRVKYRSVPRLGSVTH